MRSRPGNRRRAISVVAVCGLALSAVAAEQQAAPAVGLPQVASGILNLRTGDVRVTDRPNLLAARAATFGTARRHVLQLDGPMTPARRAALAAAGVRVGDYLPTNSFIADLSRTTPAAVNALGFVTWAGEYEAAWKIDPEIGLRTFQTPERMMLDAKGERALHAYLFEGEGAGPALEAMAAIPGAVIFGHEDAGGMTLISLTLPKGSEAALAAIPSVQFVEEAPEITPRNSTVRWIVQSNVSNSTPLYTNGLHGEGQIVGHMDGGAIGVNHCSFSDTNPIGPNHRKILAVNSGGSYDSHAGHTAATAVGDAGTNADSRGVAYLAKLVTARWPSFTEAGIFTALALHHNQGARVHTNSWGDDGTTSYNGMCRGIDDFSWKNEDSLVLFAVTNTSSLRNPENAKNLLAVGASGDSPSQNNHCSGGQGPTNDQRRKPEVYAPGCSTTSAGSSSGCSLATMGGTSMACPAVTGTGALVRQYFTDGYYPTGTANPSDGFTPTGPLIKAVLINSSVDMTGVSGYPSNREGWGRVLADNALYFAGDARQLVVHAERNNTDGALTTGEFYDQQFIVNGSGEQLRVTLAWHDAPGSVGTTFAAVNNLDLIVTAPNGAQYLGNVFSGGVSVTGGTADIRNNVEQVHVTSPMPGTWTARVVGTGVNTGSQGFALAVTGLLTAECNPSIQQQPQSQEVCEGLDIDLSVSAIGASGYQWFKDNVPLPGANSPTLTLSGISAGDTGSYHCEMTTGCEPLISEPAIVTVATYPSVLEGPESQIVSEGDPVTFSVDVEGEPLTYQWTKNGATIPGATGPSYQIAAATEGDQGNYAVLLINACDIAVSDAATLVVKPKSCPADMNGNGSLDTGDFTAFRAAYLAGDLAADFSGDGELGTEDFTAFREAYLAGCP